MSFDPTDRNRWIGQLNDLYRKIVSDPMIPSESLDKANEIILEAIEKLRPLTQRVLR